MRAGFLLPGAHFFVDACDNNVIVKVQTKENVMELEYEFEEVVVLAGGGVMAWGKAWLRPCGVNDGEFYVSSILFDGSETAILRSDIAKKRGLLQELSMAELIFNVVAHKIETSPDAQEAWSDYRSEWDA